jgi:hypothetical protein
VLPEVENPVPHMIGLGSIFNTAGAGGVLSLVLATMLNKPDTRRDAWCRAGITAGFVWGAGIYLLSLLNQLL